MANRNDSGKAIEPGMVARVAAGLRYAVTGKGPDWFGPQTPQRPQAPETVAGRQFDYPVGFNLRSQPRQDEGITFGQLRALADNYGLLRIVIETRKDQLAKMQWTVKPRDPKKQPDDRCAAAIEFFKLPDKEHGWDVWLRMLVEDLLVIDAPTIYPRKTKGGQLYALEPMDGGTVKRVLDPTGRTPMEGTAYQQVLKGLPAVDYTREELIYRPRNLRTNKVYGFSPVEQIVMTVNIALRRELHQLEYYRSGSVPDALAGVPDDWQPDQIKQFQDYWDTLMEGDSAAKRHLKFVPGDLARNFKETKQPPLKDVFDEWLARVVCFAFSIEPTPFIAQVNRATAETAREQSLAEGLAPMQNWIKGLIDYVLTAQMGLSDLEFSWADETSIDPLVQAQINVMYVNAGVLQVNEVRADLGRDPLDEPEPVDAPEQKKEPSVEGEKEDIAEEKEAAYMGEALRKARPKALRLPSKSVLAKAQKQVAEVTSRFLKQQAPKMAAQIAAHVGLKKASAAEEEEDDWLDFTAWEVLATALVPGLTIAAEFGVRETVARLAATVSSDLIDAIDTHALAVRFAKSRAAEMVGMKWVDGDLVPNPNAAWQITEGTRGALRGLTDQAVQEGWDMGRLADEIEASYSFSQRRAEMVARTEVRIAQMEGQLSAAKELGATHKEWSTAHDDEVSPECVACEEAGELPINEAFPGGEMAPPNHPNCRCSLVYLIKDGADDN